jgi:hypothetical protein
MKTLSVKAGDRLTFLGCTWDACWEYDAPAVIYSPVKRYNPFAGNSSTIDDMVESVCGDLADERQVRVPFSEGNLREFKWRRWSPRGFARRKESHHVRIVVEFSADEDGTLDFHVVDRKEQWGPFPTKEG